MHDNDPMPSLKGARVLVVQDDLFIAADLDLMVEDAGGEVVALAGSLHDALTLLGQEPIDAAVVHPDLGEGEGVLVVEELKQRDIPFVFYPRASSGNEVSAPSQQQHGLLSPRSE